MSDLFRNLGNQGAQSSRQNTQYWLDWGSSEEGKSLLEKEKAGTLADNEKPVVEAYRHFLAKGQAEGIEPTKTVSTSTGVPDFTDGAVRARKMSQTMQLLAGRGRKQSFLGGQYDSDQLGAGSMLGGTP